MDRDLMRMLAKDAIEGITSPDGRVLGKMGHTERFADGLYRNIYGNKDQMLLIAVRLES